MRRSVIFLALGLTACAGALGGPPDVPLTAVALRVAPGTAPATAAAALTQAGSRFGLLAARADSAWFAAVAAEAGLQLSGPADAGDVSLALITAPPVGDTVLELTYEGGTIPMVDALYDLDDEHYLDLMAVHVDEEDAAQPVVTRLLRYIATDVPPSAGVVLAVSVPSVAKGDSIARLLSPGYFDALRCDGGGAAAAAGAGEIRLFYGPEARLRCGEARSEVVGAGARVVAELVAGLHL